MLVFIAYCKLFPIFGGEKLSWSRICRVLQVKGSYCTGELSSVHKFIQFLVLHVSSITGEFVSSSDAYQLELSFPLTTLET
jgi:hypothetical protein